MIDQLKNLGYPELEPVPAEHKRPFWSVVIPVHDRFDFLDHCLGTALDQWEDADNMEIIVLDTSVKQMRMFTADPPSVVYGIGKYMTDPRVTYIDTEDLGLINNWNAGIKLTRGQWVHLLHDDDFVERGFYRTLRDSLEGSPFGAAYCRYERLETQDNLKVRFKFHGNKKGEVVDMKRLLGANNFLVPPAVTIKRDVYEQVGLFHPELTWSPDWELWKRVACHARWFFEPQYLANYRLHDNCSTHVTSIREKWRSLRQGIEMSGHYFPADSWPELKHTSRMIFWNAAIKDMAEALDQGNPLKAQEIMQQTRWFSKQAASPEVAGVPLSPCLGPPAEHGEFVAQDLAAWHAEYGWCAQEVKEMFATVNRWKKEMAS